MEKSIAALLLACASVAATAQVYVNPYHRNDGTPVAGHYRSAPNGTTSDNYSAPGNTNPYTGALGGQPTQPGSAYTSGLQPSFPSLPPQQQAPAGYGFRCPPTAINCN